MKKYSGWWLVPAALPLLIYPGVFIASIMGLAAHSGGTPWYGLLIVNAFFVTTLVYPLTYICSLIIYFVSSTIKNKNFALMLPYGNLLLVLLLLSLRAMGSFIVG